jgi:uncharacterized Tic20 family protein
MIASKMPENLTAMDTNGSTELTNDAKRWGMLCHFSGFAGFICPFGNIAAPLAIWLLKKDQFEFVDDQGKEALNFQITMLIAVIVAAISCFLLVGIVLFPAVVLFDVASIVNAAIKASNGERFRYPLTLRLVK